ncbi:hypothetical protein B0T24DRAFT_665277 [Lasiosphaeria ovina]|uniref:SnoaL-like domain-containing protein n=1 Tax=Lasiosphaeria ovina TaxID=92902 RepID=A0AAE0KHJ7_9PEZI|nr:hypothetical protein B0T24DRAFT_665277 [Lasiosphaeria ovina]
MSELYGTIQKTIDEYFTSLDEIFAKKSIESASRARTDDCTFAIAPASFLRDNGMPADHKLTNEQRAGHMKSQFPAMDHAESESVQAVIDAHAKTAVVQKRNHITLVNGKSITTECAVFLWFTDDGTKVKKIVQFTDTAETKKYLGMVKEAIQELNA